MVSQGSFDDDDLFDSLFEDTSKWPVLPFFFLLNSITVIIVVSFNCEWFAHYNI